MKVIQINLNHCEAAQDLMIQMIHENNIDVAIVSDPYKIPNSSTWTTDQYASSAILTCGKYPFQKLQSTKTDGYVIAKINGVTFYSCYAPPRWPHSYYEDMVDNLVEDAKNNKPVVIAGDFNAWAVDWGSRCTNQRGQTLLEAFSQLDVTLGNVGYATTFRRQGGTSIIDITFTSHQFAANLDWHVSEEFTQSDHQAVFYTLNQNRIMRSRPLHRERATGWVTKDFEEELFCVAFQDTIIRSGTASEKATNLMKQLKLACNATMRKRAAFKGKTKETYWWNDEIRLTRSECLHARRKSQRAFGRPEHEELVRHYKYLRHLLKTRIKDSKYRCLKELIDSADANPWGTAYKILIASTTRPSGPKETCPLLLKNIVEALFPHHSTRPALRRENQNSDNIPEVTIEEVLLAATRIKTKSAPGLDAIPNVAIRSAIKINPSAFVDVLQHCMIEGTFPLQWKIQKLVLLPKPGKSPGVPSSYRPICLLDAVGKVLERLIQGRLVHITEGETGLAPNQYGFRKGRSTIDAIQKVVYIAENAIKGSQNTKRYCAIVTLDVKNAFNSANWKHIMCALTNMHVPNYLLKLLDDYLKNRTLLYETSEGFTEYTVSSGVPQGSVLGPTLWNIMYNEVLKLELPKGSELIGFADDVAVVVTAKFKDEVEFIATEAVSIIQRWMDSMGLELAAHKTEIVLVSSRKRRECASVKIKDTVIESKRAVRYLGVMIDDRLNFKDHIEFMVDKATSKFAAISRMMPNIGGPRSSKRLLLVKVVTSIMLYAAPIWAKALEANTYKRRVNQLHRRCALRIMCGYRTLSSDAAYVISGLMPFDIQAEEAYRIYSTHNCNRETKREERKKSLEEWQERWETSINGRWTFRLIPDVQAWIGRTHGSCNFVLSQFLTGHGKFRSYLHRIGRDTSPNCPNCMHVSETPEHILFECPNFVAERCNLPGYEGEVVTPENIVKCMLESEEKWNAVCSTLTSIHIKLVAAEKRRSMDGIV